MAYPAFDFSSLLDETENSEQPEKMAECIQALIDLLSQEILMFDMSHIRGDEINREKRVPMVKEPRPPHPASRRCKSKLKSLCSRSMALMVTSSSSSTTWTRT